MRSESFIRLVDALEDEFVTARIDFARYMATVAGHRVSDILNAGELDLLGLELVGYRSWPDEPFHIHTPTAHVACFPDFPCEPVYRVAPTTREDRPALGSVRRGRRDG